MVTLRPLREDEYAAWDEAHRAEYERGLVEFVGMARDAARAKGERDIPAALPDGLATAGTWIWAVENDRRRVGGVFLGIRGGEAWLYDITIDPDERGKGFGRAAMVRMAQETLQDDPTAAEAMLERVGGEEEARRLFERYHIPASGRVFWGSALTNIHPGYDDTYASYKNPGRAPLLFVSGSILKYVAPELGWL